MNHLQILLTVEFDGDAALQVAEEFSLGVDAGLFDHALLNAVRGFLAYDARDWKVVWVRAALAPAQRENYTGLQGLLPGIASKGGA